MLKSLTDSVQYNVLCMTEKISSCLGDQFAEFLFAINNAKQLSTNEMRILPTKTDKFALEWQLIRSRNNNMSKLKLMLMDCPKNINGVVEIYDHDHCVYSNFSSAPFEIEFLQICHPVTNNQDDHVIIESRIAIKFKIFKIEGSAEPSDDNYLKYFVNKELSDVTFVVGAETIPAHKIILSVHGSDVFAAMFSTDMQEKSENHSIEIEDVEPDTFKLFLIFIYNCGLCRSLDIDYLLELIVLADKYRVTRLVDVCEIRIFSQLKAEDAIYVLIVADHLNALWLKDKCLDFILMHRKMVFDTESFAKIIERGHVELFADIFRQLNKKNLYPAFN